MDASTFLTCPESAFGKPVCRLGLASRGASKLSADEILGAIELGVNYLNWPGDSEGPAQSDAFSQAIAQLGAARDKVVVAIQLAARDAQGAEAELESVLEKLHTGYVDVVTLYYVEQPEEWQQLLADDSALRFCQAANRQGLVRRVGLTSHQRRLAATAAASGEIDLLMIRYNAAHRGAEQEVFPVTSMCRVPVIAYTALRWGALVRRTPLDPPGFQVPRAAQWYRFVLQNPAVSVVLAAPQTAGELGEALCVLQAAEPLDEARWQALAAHGARVRAASGPFP